MLWTASGFQGNKHKTYGADLTCWTLGKYDFQLQKQVMIICFTLLMIMKFEFL